MPCDSHNFNQHIVTSLMIVVLPLVMALALHHYFLRGHLDTSDFDLSLQESPCIVKILELVEVPDLIQIRTRSDHVSNPSLALVILFMPSTCSRHMASSCYPMTHHFPWPQGRILASSSWRAHLVAWRPDPCVLFFESTSLSPKDRSFSLLLGEHFPWRWGLILAYSS